jgi:hypothetical protein
MTAAVLQKKTTTPFQMNDSYTFNPIALIFCQMFVSK